MDEQAIDSQDSALENTDAKESKADDKTSEDFDAKLKAAEAEVAKWKRIAERKAKKQDDDDSDSSKDKPDSQELLQKTFLRAAGINAEKEVELALATAKKWDMPIDKLVDDEDFKAKLEKLRTAEANEAATSAIKGSGATQGANQTPEYWIAKGTPPTPDQVPDRKVRASIARAMVANSKSGKKFYNE